MVTEERTNRYYKRFSAAFSMRWLGPASGAAKRHHMGYADGETHWGKAKLEQAVSPAAQ